MKGAIHVKRYAQGSDSLFSFRHGLDVSLCRIPPSLCSRLDHRRLPKPYQDLSRLLRDLHNANDGSDHHLPRRVWASADRPIVAHWPDGTCQRGLRRGPDDHPTGSRTWIGRSSRTRTTSLSTITWSAGVLVTLIVTRAGHVFGLDAWEENSSFVKDHPVLKRLVAGRAVTRRTKGARLSSGFFCLSVCLWPT